MKYLAPLLLLSAPAFGATADEVIELQDMLSAVCLLIMFGIGFGVGSRFV